MPGPRRLAAFLPTLLSLLWCGGCGRATQPVAPPPPAADRCLVAADSTGTADRIGVAFGRLDAAEEARRAMSALPPIRLGCDGRPAPALASAWSSDSSGRFWTLVLASTSPGASRRWTAGDLAAAWRADAGAREALRYGGVESLLPLDDARLVVGFAAPHSELPALFADATLAVPPVDTSAPPALDVIPAGRDLRDALDTVTDVVVTDDPSIVDYANTRGGRTAVALPWSRVYLLVVPPTQRLPARAIGADTAGFRASLAGDAVHADARASSADWWDSTATCWRWPRPAAAPATAAALLYPREDRVARELAERLIALEADAGLTARALDPESFRASLRVGAGRAFLVSAPLHPTVPCREVDRWPAGSTVIALVETRDHALVRRGAPPLSVAWDGTLRPAAP